MSRMRVAGQMSHAFLTRRKAMDTPTAAARDANSSATR